MVATRRSGGTRRQACPVEDLPPVGNFPVLRHFDESDLAALLALAVTGSYGKGEAIRPPLERGGDIAAVRGGATRLILGSTDGKEIALSSYSAGDLFEVPSSASSNPAAVLADAAVDETTLSFLPSRPFMEAAVSVPKAAAELLALLWRHRCGERAVFGDLFCLTARARLAGKLMELARQDADYIVRVRQDELGLLVGVARDKVTKALRDFRRYGWVAHEAHSHEIRVLDTKQLTEAAGERV